MVFEKQIAHRQAVIILLLKLMFAIFHAVSEVQPRNAFDDILLTLLMAPEVCMVDFTLHSGTKQPCTDKTK